MNIFFELLRDFDGCALFSLLARVALPVLFLYITREIVI